MTDPRNGAPIWTVDKIRALGAITDLKTAAAILGFSRTAAYEMLHRGQFPLPIIRAGTKYRVPVGPLLTLLHVDPTPNTDDPYTT
jgi:hypothetical protein